MLHNSFALLGYALIWKPGNIGFKIEAFGLAPRECGQAGVVEQSDKGSEVHHFFSYYHCVHFSGRSFICI